MDGNTHGSASPQLNHLSKINLGFNWGDLGLMRMGIRISPFLFLGIRLISLDVSLIFFVISPARHFESALQG